MNNIVNTAGLWVDEEVSSEGFCNATRGCEVSVGFEYEGWSDT